MLVLYGYPVYVVEERVTFDLFCSQAAYSLRRIPQYEFVSEVDVLFADIGRQVLSHELDLTHLQSFSDFGSILSFVRSLRVTASYRSDDELVHYYSDRVEIRDERMVLPEHDLWRHIAWRTGGVGVVSRSQNSANAEVRDVDEALLVKDYVLGLDVSVNDVLRVDVL